jgi:hypothetical protein
MMSGTFTQLNRTIQNAFYKNVQTSLGTAK